ncbi:MAG: hypothetical protein ABS98_00965 [Lysobacteraceae bacterium SCN 69-48]|nr:MAG: hypothetical protein ABS98_00965 [Xanthomonadaceae bacterium SCN 69-48]
MTGTRDAVSDAFEQLDSDPAQAKRQANEILKATPGHPGAQLLLGMAASAEGDHLHAAAILAPLTVMQPRFAMAWLALGVACKGAGQPAAATDALNKAIALQPSLPCAWLTLAEVRFAAGDDIGADAAYLQHLHQSHHDPVLTRCFGLLTGNRLQEAAQLLDRRLRQQPGDVAAMRMLAEVEIRSGRNAEAIKLLERVLERAPGFDAARQNYAVALNRSNRYSEALGELDVLLGKQPDNQVLKSMRATVLGKLGEYETAIATYEGILQTNPERAELWLNYGHALKTAGRRDDSIAAYRRCIALRPEIGVAWWSLANLKTVRFLAADIAAMRAQLQRDDLDEDSRLHLEFALGKAQEDAGDYADAFIHYRSGNALRRRQLPYDADQARASTLQTMQACSHRFFAERAGSGCPAADPIFVVGMPRAGSTLIEQILASHPLVEGTMELPAIIAITRDLRLRDGNPGNTSYHEVLAGLDHDGLCALGEHYLERTRVQRKLGRPFFIDKMPNNFAHVGLIHLILPKAKIIDARRHPLACGLSNFKQHFARGQAFSYDLADMGRYYADYVALMAHFDQVLPGRVHRVIYEEMVDDTETQVRALLAYCGLEFDQRCLRFFENDRAVRTASSEQVRRPIYRDGVDQWRHFEPWLGPLKQALGPVLDAYPLPP